MTAASVLVVVHSSATDATPSPMPNISASLGVTLPAGMGRVRVRFMIWSMSRSKYMFSALAEPDAMAVPSTVVTTKPGEGISPGMTNNVRKPVTRTRSIMVGLVSARKSPAVRRTVGLVAT